MARVNGPSTIVPGCGLSFTMMMLVIVMLPMLVIAPVKVSNPPGATAVGGQNLAILKTGFVITGQEAVALLLTVWPQTLVPMAVNVSTAGPQKFSAIR